MVTAAFGSTPAAATGPTEPQLPPGRVVGEWRIERRVADGGMGSIYTAVHPVLEKRVAVKVLHESFLGDAAALGRFRDEARIPSRISHRNIVEVYSFGTLPDGRPYFVMEWLAGLTLQLKLERGPLPLGEALDIIDQVAAALQAAHAHSVVHRDIKPENILLCPNGDAQDVKLLDFGIAKLTSSQRDGATGVVVGTPEYFSPEQARGGLVDARSDIYSLGLVLFEAVVGKRAFDGDSPIDLAHQHLHTPAPRLCRDWPAAPLVLDRLIASMLAKDPAHRPSLVKVRAVLQSVSSTAPPRPLRRRRGWMMAAIVLLGAVAVAAASQSRPKLPPPPPQSPPPEAAAMCEAAPPPKPPPRVRVRLSNELIDPFGPSAR